MFLRFNPDDTTSQLANDGNLYFTASADSTVRNKPVLTITTPDGMLFIVK